ncbi:MAG: hypothetical protein LKJ25_06235 [Clostridia bacterium]|jgi:hypothetical protein|nr:hypothetical protein [Clostridia bacterium]
MDFSALIDPSKTLGAFAISMAASIIVAAISGFFCGKKYEKHFNIKNSNLQNNNINNGDANQGCNYIEKHEK